MAEEIPLLQLDDLTPALYKRQTSSFVKATLSMR